MARSNILGPTPVDRFLADYWQRQPLLVRGALPNFEPPLDGHDLAALSLQDEVESRLVETVLADNEDKDDHIKLSHGPFSDATFANLPERDWTLLVQAVNLWTPDLNPLLDHFSFLPPWRLDDIMASFAVPGGSVGPHFDQYDVFLLQITGERYWRIGQRCDESSTLSPSSDLSTLSGFDELAAWTLGPGDMLYVPPGVAHWGVAETECLTFSIGFRSPTLFELMDDLAAEIGSQPENPVLTDPPLTEAMASTKIDPAFVSQVQAMLSKLIGDEQLLGTWLAKYMTRPKYADLTKLTEELRTAEFGGKRFVNGELQD